MSLHGCHCQSRTKKVTRMKLKKGYKFILELGDRKLNKYEIVGTDLYVLIEMLEKLTPYAPPIDVQPVVRCRDCMNWIPGHITDTDEFIPPKCGKYQQMVGHSSDDFCSLGELKDGE